MNTVIVKGRIFSLDDSFVNEIERTCMQLGKELHPPPPAPPSAAPASEAAVGRVRAALSKGK